MPGEFAAATANNGRRLDRSRPGYSFQRAGSPGNGRAGPRGERVFDSVGSTATSRRSFVLFRWIIVGRKPVGFPCPSARGPPARRGFPTERPILRFGSSDSFVPPLDFHAEIAFPRSLVLADPRDGENGPLSAALNRFSTTRAARRVRRGQPSTTSSSDQ